MQRGPGEWHKQFVTEGKKDLTGSHTPSPTEIVVETMCPGSDSSMNSITRSIILYASILLRAA